MFLERGEEREKERETSVQERNLNQPPLTKAPSGARNHNLHVLQPRIEPATLCFVGRDPTKSYRPGLIFIYFLFLKVLFIFWRGRREGEREGKKHQCVVASCAPPYWGSGSQPRHVPWLVIKPVTLWFADHCSTTEPHQPGLILIFLNWIWERERETSVCCSPLVFCIHWLILVCAPIRDQTHNLGVSGWQSNQLSSMARAPLGILKAFLYYQYFWFHLESASCFFFCLIF